jgi:xylulokinase
MYLAIDIGTSSVKAALVAEEGHAVARARYRVRSSHRDRHSHEVDPAQWIKAIARMMSTMRPDTARSIRAVAISGNGPTLLSCDAAGNPLHDALLWMDTRARDEAREAGDAAGYRIDPAYYLPKALWLQRHDEATRERGRWFLSCPEYLAFALTGEAVAYLPAPGYERFVWEIRVIEALGLPKERFPRFVRHGETIAPTRQGNPCALPAGIPVVAAYPDFLASIVGSGAIAPGRACDRSGSSEAINFCASTPFPDDRMFTLPHAIEGLWNVSGGLSTSGKALEWLEDKLSLPKRTDPSGDGEWRGIGEGEAIPTPPSVELALRSKPGAGGALFVPYLSGERAPLWNPSLRGALLGLSIEHTREDLARAALEGTCYALRYVCDVARSGGIGAETLRASGVLAVDPKVACLKAAILGLPVELPEMAESELSGDACACAVGVGDAKDFVEASARVSRVAARIEPSRDDEAVYAERYGEFLEALGSTRSISRELAAAQEHRA